MAALMRCMRSVCRKLEPALMLRQSTSFSSSCFEEDLMNLKSGEKHVQDDEGAEGRKHVCCPSALESTPEDKLRNAGHKHRDTTRKVSQSRRETQTSTRPTSALSPKVHVESLRYEKAKCDDKRVIRLVHLARSKKLREQQGKILLEGRRLIAEALEAGASPLAVFFSAMERLQELPVNKLAQASLVKVKLEDVQIWPDHDAKIDMIAVFKRPEASQMCFPEERCGKPLPLTLICDNLRDPGNLGVTLRCAAAAGCHSVLLSTGCVDVWEPKVLRAGLGAHFRLPMIPNLSWTNIQTLLPPNAIVHVADNSGVSETEPELAGASQRAKKAGDYGWTSSRRISRKAYCEDEDEEEEVGGARQEVGPGLKTQPYHSNWTGSHVAVVIGGETHGLSLEALRLAEETKGRRLFIPMVRGVDSLNAAMAASVLLFEGRRQLSES
ncbi:hypothetical protein Q7C36_017956 [Tachysurus vachellii]|uniref:RNA 2-O ribose methyltransferase substrate binding domain-containing protein n=1 Tax=Tachysurus vachellii TaxID=175792 RepID=A0AA88LZ96_TACVA|nr:hypothetical protein Q7C36_017956 [Tachysurus vachellii]